jgi:hypothetical protein
MEAEQEARRIAEEGTMHSAAPDTAAGQSVTLTPVQASDLAADVALANESLTAARLLLATDRVGDGVGNTVEGYLSEAQESARRLYSALVAARGILPATVRAGTAAAEGERRRLLYLLEQAREIADRLGSAGGAEAASYAASVGALASRLRAELGEDSVAEHAGPAVTD